MVRKENRLYNTVSIILKIQVVTWICQDLDTVLIKTLQLRNRFSERTTINQCFRIMRRKKKDVIKSILKLLQEIQMEYAYDKTLRVGIFTGSTRNDIIIEISRCDDTSSDCQYVIEGREFVFSLRKSCSDNEFTLFEVRSYISALKGS